MRSWGRRAPPPSNSRRLRWATARAASVQICSTLPQSAGDAPDFTGFARRRRPLPRHPAPPHPGAFASRRRCTPAASHPGVVALRRRRTPSLFASRRRYTPDPWHSSPFFPLQPYSSRGAPLRTSPHVPRSRAPPSRTSAPSSSKANRQNKQPIFFCLIFRLLASPMSIFGSTAINLFDVPSKDSIKPMFTGYYALIQHPF